MISSSPAQDYLGTQFKWNFLSNVGQNPLAVLPIAAVCPSGTCLDMPEDYFILNEEDRVMSAGLLCRAVLITTCLTILPVLTSGREPCHVGKP